MGEAPRPQHRPDYRGWGSALRAAFGRGARESLPQVPKPEQPAPEDDDLDHAVARVREAAASLEAVAHLSAAVPVAAGEPEGIREALQRVARELGKK